jgi:hypothetical protein
VWQPRPTLVGMFERFTDRARRVVVLAQEEARLLNHNYIGTEHILLGLVHEGEGVAAKALESLDIPLDAVRTEVEAIIGGGPQAPDVHIPFTPRAKKVLELSLREAMQLGHNYIGTEHILLGLIREGEGVGAQVLMRLGASLDLVRQRVIQLLSGHAGPAPQATAPAPSGARVLSASPPMLAAGGFGYPVGKTCSFCGRDFWEVDRYVIGSSAVICDVCVDAARAVVAGAPEGAGQALHLPPRVFGDTPPTADAVSELDHVVQAVFGGGDPQRSVARFLEDGERLEPLRAQAGARHPRATGATVHLDRVRFRGPTEADIRFTIRLSGAPGPVVDGEAIFADGRWQMSRETFCQVMRMAGVQCPPPEPPGD